MYKLKKIIFNSISYFQVIYFIVFVIIFKISGIFLKKRKYTIGTHDTARNVYNLKSLIENSYTVNLQKNNFYSFKYDYQISNLILSIIFGPILFAYLINKTKIGFIYIWYRGFFTDRKFDYYILKLFNKKIITIFVGDDIRSPKLTKDYVLNNKIDSYINYYEFINKILTTETYDNEKKYIAKYTDKYSDIIFNSEKDNISYLKNKQNVFFYIMYAEEYKVNIEKFQNIKNIKIVHAPTSPLWKGTPLVRAAIKKLELEGYIFEYEEIIGKPNEFVKKVLANSHILLNQFYNTVPALLGIEGMITKNCVLMSADPKFNTFDIPPDAEDCWVVTGYWEIYDKLKWLLDNPKLIEGYAERGRAFVERHYTIEKAREKFYKIFRENGIEI